MTNEKWMQAGTGDAHKRDDNLDSNDSEKKNGDHSDHPDRDTQSDKMKQEEKEKGLVDEDHPFPPKGN